VQSFSQINGYKRQGCILNKINKFAILSFDDIESCFDQYAFYGGNGCKACPFGSKVTCGTYKGGLGSAARCIVPEGYKTDQNTLCYHHGSTSCNSSWDPGSIKFEFTMSPE